jgi:hypothetical protein
MSNEIATVANYRVRQGAEMIGLINAVKRALEGEVGTWARSSTGAESFKRWLKIADMTGKQVAPLTMIFKEMRAYALEMKAPLTADAIRQSAKWFYENVEGSPAAPTPSVFTPSPLAASTLPIGLDAAVSQALLPEAKKRRRKKKGLFDLKTSLIVGIPAALGVGLLIYTISSRKKQAAWIQGT